MNGSKEILSYELKSSSGNTVKHVRYIEGVKTRLERLYHETSSEFLREYYAKFLRDKVCTTCHGARLNEAVLSVKVNGLNIYEFMKDLHNHLTENQWKIAELVVNEILNRTSFLINVGLGYLTLSRYAMTLSGGESQRIRLATQIGSKLSGVLYVLDEPSIGLHQRDSEKLINALKEMRDLGNTIIVVEHDEAMIRRADYLVDIGR